MRRSGARGRGLAGCRPAAPGRAAPPLPVPPAGSCRPSGPGPGLWPSEPRPTRTTAAAPSCGPCRSAAAEPAPCPGRPIQHRDSPQGLQAAGFPRPARAGHDPVEPHLVHRTTASLPARGPGRGVLVTERAILHTLVKLPRRQVLLRQWRDAGPKARFVFPQQQCPEHTISLCFCDAGGLPPRPRAGTTGQGACTRALRRPGGHAPPPTGGGHGETFCVDW
jgi:hypothetical protein